MKKLIKDYLKYGDHCGVAKQVQGKIVDALQDESGRWHFSYFGEKWVASDHAFDPDFRET